MPIAASVTSRAEPPKLTSGSGMPVIGSRPTTAPMLMTAWHPNHAVTANEQSRTKGSVARWAMRMPL